MSEADFAALKDGVYDFCFRNPNGSLSIVRLHLWCGRKKVRSAQLDLWQSNYNLRGGSEFARENQDYRDAHRRDLKGQRVMVPSDSLSQTTLTFSALKCDMASWLLRAARLICTVENLQDIRVAG
jgi:hypothetical protein